MADALRVARALLAEAAIVRRERDPDVAGHVAAPLYREAMRWALRAIDPATPLPAGVDDLVREGAQVGDAPPESLAAVAEQLVALAEAASPAVQRARRLGKGVWAAIVTATAIAVAVPAVDWALRPRDLAEGRPFRTSSSAGECHPEKSECLGARTRIFFHTTEEPQPWVELDLGRPTTFRAITVVNRSDGDRERALPLTLEASDDQTTWKPLARREDPFTEWRAAFEPATARYVRARAERRTILHLEAVRVHP